MKFLMILGAAALAAMTPSVAMAQHHGDRGVAQDQQLQRPFHGSKVVAGPCRDRHDDVAVTHARVTRPFLPSSRPEGRQQRREA